MSPRMTAFGPTLHAAKLSMAARMLLGLALYASMSNRLRGVAIHCERLFVGV